MPIKVNTNFEVNTSLPIDERLVQPDIASRDGIPLTWRYEGMTVYVVDQQTDYRLIGGTNNTFWVTVPISASHANNSDFALTASFALNGGGSGGGSNLIGSNNYVPYWNNNNLTTGSLIWTDNGHVAVNTNLPTATDTFTVTEVTNSKILWNPTLLSIAPRLWFRGDAIPNQSGSLMNLWEDSSPYQNHATASNTASLPIFAANVLNGQPAVRFDGVNDGMRVMGPASISASVVTAFVVARVTAYSPSSVVSNVGTIFGNSHPGDSKDIVVGELFDGGSSRFAWTLYTEDTISNFGTSTPVSPFNAKTGEWYINTVIVNAAASSTTLYLSGSASGSGASAQSTNLDLRDLYIGYETSSNQPFNGDIAEIIILTSSLSTNDQQSVEGYLAWKYGLQASLPNAHPYRNVMPTPAGGGNIQVWKDFNNNLVGFFSSSGILYATASNAISASWAPNNAGFAISASWASQSLSSSTAVSASYAQTASFAFTSVSASWAPPIPSDVAISASWASQSFWSTSGSFASQSIWAISASFASMSNFNISSSWASQSLSASHAITSSFAVTASFATNLNPNAVSASWASQSLSSSYAQTASFALLVQQTISASFATFAQSTLSASWASMSISASWAPPIPSNFAVSSSWASESIWATTASFASKSFSATSASWASKSFVSDTASFASQSISSSFAISASWSPPQNNAFALSASWASMSISASYATQASASFTAISASWAPTFGTVGTNFYVPKWVGNSLTTASLIYDSGVSVGINATASQIDGAFTVEAFTASFAILWDPSYLTVPSRLWLRADDVAGATSASVSLWPDTGSYNNYFTQSNATIQPFVVNSALNGHNVVHFNGANQRMQSVSGSTSITQSSLCVFVVARPNTYPTSLAANSTADVIANGHSGNSNDFGVGPRTLSGVREWSLYNETNVANFDINALASISQSWYIINGNINANNSIITAYINNAATSSGVVNGSNLIDLRDMFVGFEPSFGVPFNGDIAEILITSQVLSPTEQRIAEGYLAWKYGLQNNLPFDHPYINRAPYELDANVIQSWKDNTSTRVSYVDTTGLYVGTASWANNAISASWAPPSGVSAFAVSASWASQSLSASFASTASFAFLGTNNSPNFLPKWLNSGSLTTASLLYDNGIRIGINTISPSGSLTINYDTTDSTNTVGLNTHLLLSNPDPTGQTSFGFISGSSLTAKIRSDFVGGVYYSAFNVRNNANSHVFMVGADNGGPGAVGKLRIMDAGIYIGQSIAGSTPTALLELGGGDGTSGRGQLKFDSTTLLSSPEAGAVEFNADKWFCTIQTGTARKEFAINDIPLASGSLVGVTTNGRLINASGSNIWPLTASNSAQTYAIYISSSTVNQNFFVPFVANTGSQPVDISSIGSLTFNPATSTLTVSNITASLFGTSSWAISSSWAALTPTASFAQTASFLNGFVNFAISASFASQSISASWAPVPISASWASQSISASYARQSDFSVSSSWASMSISASWSPPIPSDFSISASFASASAFATSASFSSQSISSSYVPTGRSVVLCSAYTPTLNGPDPAEVTIPFSPIDGVTAQSWSLKRISFRAQTVESNTSSINIEKSITASLFSASFLGTVTLPSGSFENFTTASAGTSSIGSIISGNKIRFNVTALGTSTNWTIITELSNS